MTIATFKKKFAKVREKGWVASKRKGPTGVGQTLEHYLGMKENNIALPDLGTVELKAHRIGSLEPESESPKRQIGFRVGEPKVGYRVRRTIRR